MQTITGFYDACMASRELAPELKTRIRFEYASWLLTINPHLAYPILESLQNLVPPEPLKSRVNLALGDYFFSQGEIERAYYIFKGLADSLSSVTGAAAGLRAGDALLKLGRKNEAFEEYLKISFIFPDYRQQVKSGLEQAYALAIELGRAEEAAGIKQQLTDEFGAIQE